MTNKRRKLIAIGDLHGDFHRLLRILREQKILDPAAIRWTDEAKHLDLILLGDYVDWRGEPLEGPREEWPLGPRKLVETLYDLFRQNQKLCQNKAYRGRFYPLLGNHDAMMLESYDILEKLCREEKGILERCRTMENLFRFFSSEGLDPIQEENLMKVLNWYQQGGEATIHSFGGLHGWMAAIGGELGEFLRKLPLAVKINGKLFCHSVPDEKEYWIPIYEKQGTDNPALKEQFLWGRKLWGYDAFAGLPVKPFTESEIDEMLSQMKVNAVVVGHTFLRHNGPFLHYGGKVINLDTHGIPGSRPFTEEYEVKKKPHPAKKGQLKKKLSGWKHLGKR